MFLKIVNGVLISTYSLSSLITILNNACSNNRIRRKGFIIKSIDENSISENIKYFIKDFGFLFVPIYNLIHSIKDTIKNDSEFDEVKMSKLRDRDRLVEYHEPKVVKEEKKVIEPVKEEKKEDKSVPVYKVEKTKEELLLEKIKYYKDEYDRVFSLRTKFKEEGASNILLNKYTAELRDIVSKYKASCAEYKAYIAQNKPSSSQMKLIRK